MKNFAANNPGTKLTNQCVKITQKGDIYQRVRYATPHMINSRLYEGQAKIPRNFLTGC